MAQQLAPCGTLAAYRRHLRAGETPCPACRTANRTAKRDQADQRRRGRTSTAASIPPAAAAPTAPPPAPPTREASVLVDLLMVRDVLAAAVDQVKREDPTRLGPLVRELRETWKALDVANRDAPAASEDEFTVARRARAATHPERP